VLSASGKIGVGAGVEIHLRAGDGAVHAFGGRGVGAGDDVEVAARLAGGGDLGGHVVGVGELLVVEVAAFLGQQLVLDMDGGRARVLEGTDHVHDVEGLAVAGVAIDEDGEARGAGDLADEEADLVDR
jgi:hypothetical protein